ncbi:MAG: hypothetical protein ACQZ3N_08335 [cyanobacterium endosymbiont of Rhopalodia yunnanensis]
MLQKNYDCRLHNDDNITYKQRTYQEVTKIIQPIAGTETYRDNPDVL